MLRIQPSTLPRRLLLFPAILLVLLAYPALADDWPRWRGRDGAGVWHPPAPLRELARGLPQLWRQPLGPGYSGIAVAGGRVYTQDRPAEPAEHERVVCFDAATGKVVWEHVYPAEYGGLDYGKGPRATPLIDDGRVYTMGAVGHFHCLDAATGEVIFARDLKADYGARQPEWGFAASPIRFGENIIVHPGAADGCYMAFDRRSGELRWRGGTDPCGYATPIIVQRAAGPLLVGWTPENVVGLDARTGEELWKISYPVTYGVSIASPMFRDELVLVSGYWEGTKAIRLSAEPRAAELVWEENRKLRGLMSDPLYRDGHVYLLDKYFGVACFELATGKVLWTDENTITPADRNPQASLVWIGDTDQALALNAEGELVLVRLQPSGYEVLGRTQVVGKTWAHPAYAGDVLYARDDEQIVAVRLTE